MTMKGSRECDSSQSETALAATAAGHAAVKHAVAVLR